ncbi:polyhydroxyalkanoate biosynthesis repressor PhaR [Caryophanon tenue]|uniref:Polyhydroxyalkanoate biosynthesis repressor PhaR n=1 Tax=Caryophanon tenue TaxID=33978 RepID=A0A1C0YIY1_9BACL|nr:polyhydroxyalkanoate biosynthesis repressor PhaR [Caryophanon tenue]OCS87103.1 polyhydroxyalkanoate biosynthesis repressor PhaR [Caryophanon tenue]
MTNNTSFDAFSLWKSMYDQTENTWRDVIEKTLEQPSFAEGLGQVQSQYLQMQGFVNGLTENYLKQMNMPTRDEIAQVASLVINVDTKVDDLTDELEAQLDGPLEAQRKEIDALKKSVTKLDKKLDTIITLLNTSIANQAGPVPSTSTPSPKTELPKTDVKKATPSTDTK